MASTSTQKPFAKNKDSGLGKYSFKSLALIRNTLSESFHLQVASFAANSQKAY